MKKWRALPAWFSAGKLGSRDERRETFVEYDPWDTAEYATAYWVRDLHKAYNFVICIKSQI